MSSRPRRAALTMVEVLVVVGAAALLGAVATPSVMRLHARDNQATCLSNLRQIAMASHTYAAEDPRTQLVPLHRGDVTTLTSIGFPSTVGWSKALPRAFGGATPTQPITTYGGTVITVMLDSYYGGDPTLNPWGAATRPLNSYVPGGNTELFHCPADAGDPLSAGSPGAPCFDCFGNSYRSDSIGVVWIAGAGLMRARLSSGAQGHAAWDIENPARTILYPEPDFYWFTRYPTGQGEMPGWHGQAFSDNVAYCDGSARITVAGPRQDFSLEELQAMGFCPDYVADYETFLRRGPGWQADCYPAPGAVIQVFSDSGVSLWDPVSIEYASGWPFEHYTLNEVP
jgi:type II secretory pathway pseudopilin PulG